MEFFFCAVLFSIVVFVVAGFVQSAIHPPILIQPDQLPEVITQELKTYFPDFLPSQIRHQKVRQKYQIDGTIGGLRYELEIDLTPDGELEEIELEDPRRPGKLVNLKPIPNSMVPIHLADRMQVVLAHDPAPINSSLAFVGLLVSETAYRIKIQTDISSYKFVFLESGHLVEYEKKIYRH